MRTVAGHFLLFSFSGLAFLHLYWAAGGRAGLHRALPQRDGAVVAYPPRLATLAVAMGLAGCAFLVSERLGYSRILPPSIPKVSTWVMAVLFLVRVIGDSRYAGLFRTVKDTDFARMDAWVYTPLCILLAVCLALVAAG